jgi:hypothetical protein
MVVLDPDARQVRQTARGPLGFLARVGGYRSNFTRMGFTDSDVGDRSS